MSGEVCDYVRRACSELHRWAKSHLTCRVWLCACGGAWALAGTCAVAGVVGGAGGPWGQTVFLRSSAALAVAENHLCWLVVTLRKTTNVVSRNSVGRCGKPPGG